MYSGTAPDFSAAGLITVDVQKDMVRLYRSDGSNAEGGCGRRGAVVARLQQRGSDCPLKLNASAMAANQRLQLFGDWKAAETARRAMRATLSAREA